MTGSSDDHDYWHDRSRFDYAQWRRRPLSGSADLTAYFPNGRSPGSRPLAIFKRRSPSRLAAVATWWFRCRQRWVVAACRVESETN